MTDAPPFHSAARTHPGNIRPVNEDSHLAHDAAGVWAVADGMGGHEAGDMASRMLTDALKTIAAPHSAADLLAECEACVVEVNERLLAIASQRGTTIGTTLALLLGYETHFACVWSGDSRIYLLREGHIAMLSHDHTEVQELVDRGILTVEEGRASARRNVITRAIGVTPRAELESVQGVFEPGDVFVLCSDGLTTYVSDDELLRQAGSLPAPEACESLIALALARGGSDNVTVIIVHYGSGHAPPARMERTRDTVIDLSSPGGVGLSAERDWS